MPGSLVAGWPASGCADRSLPFSKNTRSGIVKITAGVVPDFRYFPLMSQVAELLKEASKLDPLDRAELVSSLLEDLDPSPHWVSDEEVFRRLEDLKSGRVKGLSEEEFWKACGR